MKTHAIVAMVVIGHDGIYRGYMGLVFSVRGWDFSFTPPGFPQSSITDWVIDEIPFQPESGFLGHRSH